ncbi:hypothetical protein [Aeromicrobium fastidiosum]|uniref:Tat pathway signal sequence domain protein n=1 Tax=Aeromicrobium fastidiosum TaxID=52699 RepID=A0A641AQQ8_9ACTN|nr:hypothetical protein [Aeromicrobium fastidiosum]KAA1380436.1 hypothetical protein ESP62_004445 [Aeromicrobium fastidiosum]MBP2390015.1 hypothetical protein [Aeromicrobium fastidiosum]
MRSSLLSRSVVAAAALAIGSVALAAVPANAATSTGITRDMVLAAASVVRAEAGSSQNPESGGSPATQAALNALVSRTCDLSSGKPVQSFGSAVDVPDGVDGVAVTAVIATSLSPSDLESVETCSFVAVAPVGNVTTFTGSVTVRTLSIVLENGGIGFGSGSSSTKVFELSGDVFASPRVQAKGEIAFAGLQADGLVKSPVGNAFTTTKVADKKSKAVKKAAKKKYERRIAAAKKTYAKALKRAGRNAAERTAARTAYVSRRAAVRSTYAYSIAGYKLVKIRSTQTDGRRFSASTDNFLFS